MFKKETYKQRRALLKKALGSGVYLFLGNDELSLNYADSTFRYRQDSSFLYFFGLSFAGLSAIIDVDEDKEIIFGNELTIDDIVWMGVQPTLKEKSEMVGVTHTEPTVDLGKYLARAQKQGREIHYLPPYRPEHQLKLMDLLGIKPAAQKASYKFMEAICNQRIYKSDEELAEIDKSPSFSHSPIRSM